MERVRRFATRFPRALRDDIVQDAMLKIVRLAAADSLGVRSWEAVAVCLAKAAAHDAMRAQRRRGQREAVGAWVDMPLPCLNAYADMEEAWSRHLESHLTARQCEVARRLVLVGQSRTKVARELGLATSEVRKIAVAVWKRLRVSPPPDDLVF